MAKNVTKTLLTILSLLLASCATYYQTHGDFNRDFEKGELDRALETLKKSDQLANGKSKFIYYANNGLLLSIMGKYQESNEYFEKAYLFGEDYRINYLNEAASYLTNPNFTVYRGEDHEHLMLLYFKALNYLKLGNREDALVECRRMNTRLQQLSDRYSSDRKFRRDAFVHMLMGIIYQSDRDYNNAFVAYRNALEVYEEDYSRLFNIEVPEQLKTDLMDAAWRSGFMEEFNTYKEKFNMPEYTPGNPEAELVFFWHNGLCPVKDEWSINFAIRHQEDNVVFVNEHMGFSFPFKVDEKDKKQGLSNLEVFRVAFPKYTERPVYYKEAYIEANDTVYSLQLSEDINKVAFHSLQERMVLELSKGLLRAAAKKATEHSLRKEDQTLGAVIGLVNAMTERADTRNWQTLPHSIHYCRIPIKQGKNEIKFVLEDKIREKSNYSFTYTAAPGETLFHTFSSLETEGFSNRYY
jgi:hypothetical protein